MVLITTDSVSFLATDSGTGVLETRYSLDGAPEAISTGSFTLAAGTHTLAFRSQDNVLNLETPAVVSLTVLAEDSTAPTLAVSPVEGSTVTTARPAISAAYFDAGRGIDLSSVRLFLDGSDVSGQSVVTASSAVYNPPADLAQGYHVVAASVTDLAGNRSVASTRFFIDSIAPVTSLQVGEPKAGSEPTYVASTTAFGLQSSEPAQTFYAVDAGGFVLFASSFTIASEGAHELTYYSEDPYGNREAVRTASVFTDATAPVTTLLVNGQPVSGTSLVAISTDVFGFATADAGSGTAEIRFSLDAGTEQVFASTFSLSAGTRELRFFALDRLGNREAARLVTVEVSGPDTQAPTVNFALAAGSTITASFPTLSVSFFDASGVDPASVRFFLDSVDVTSQAVVTASSASFTPAAGLSQGYHLAEVTARDYYGNLAQASVSFYIDSIPPATQLVALGTYTVQGSLIISQAGSSLTLTAQDPVVDGYSTGVSNTYYLVDLNPGACPGGIISACPGSVFAMPFVLAPGTHTVYYASRDQAGNLEAVQLATAAADGAAPMISIQSPSSGETYRALTSTVAIRFTVADAFDPAPSVAAFLVQVEDRGTSRGVRPALVAVINGQDFSAENLDDGLWELRVSATDFVLNPATSVSGVFEIVHDVLPPRTSLSVGAPQFGPEPVFVATTTPMAFTVSDDLMAMGDAAGLGAANSFYSVDGSSFVVFAGSFTLSVDGPRAVRFFSVDLASNTEAVRTSTVGVDGTAPVTRLLVNGTPATSEAWS